jgi:hypothetical protein
VDYTQRFIEEIEKHLKQSNFTGAAKVHDIDELTADIYREEK